MKERVLVVDDSRPNRMVAEGHLAMAGYQVTSVDSGEDALAVLTGALGLAFDLVVLDVMMPGIGGYETCRRIRATPAIADLPVLFLTALGASSSAQPAIEAGGDDLLSKPFNHAELLLRVRSLIRQRHQARQLEAQNRQLRKISQMIVHDLRGPCTAIMANADLLAEEMLPGDPGEAVADIATAVRHLDRTVRDLLDLSTAEDIGLSATMEHVELPGLAGEVARTLRGYGRGKHIAIRCDIRVRELVADRELLRRMLQNLVHNALKHAPARSDVVIDAEADGGGVLLRVLDQGPGIAPEERERVFERYVSAGSHGLGLAFCRLVAEAHGGQIWVEPRTPHGAVFCVRIPQVAAGTQSRVMRLPTLDS